MFRITFLIVALRSRNWSSGVASVVDRVEPDLQPTHSPISFVGSIP